MMEFMDEALLLSEIRKDNEDAFAFLFKKSFPRLLGYAVRFVENEEVALDIVQECFLNFWEKRNLLVAVSVTSLLFAMVRNSCLNYLKHEAVVEKHRIEYLAKVGGYGLLYEELEQQIKSVIDNLPERCREVFVLSRFENLKNREIAEQLRISTTAVEKQIAKALDIFARHFKEKYPMDVCIVVLAWLIDCK